MLVGACGICCDPACGLFAKNICQGCNREFAEQILCPVLKCAVSKNIEYCGRDCQEFPCEIIKQGYPYSEAYIGMYSSRMTS